jgi:glycosyltransferase involved in cell wall biosynthesis
LESVIFFHRPAAKGARVAVVSEPGKAGVKTHVVDLLRGLDLDRFDVTLYYSLRRSDEDYPRELHELAARGVRCVEIPMQDALAPRQDLRALRMLTAELRRLRPQILHLHSSKAGGLGRLASLFLWPRPRVLYAPHGMACYRSRLYLWLERVLGPLTHVPVAVSASEKRDFIRWRIPRARATRVLTMGVRPPSEEPEPTAGDTQAWYVGACGRICYQKHARLFFELAIRMAGEGKYRFRWIGDFGDDAEAAEVRAMLDRAGWPPEIEITGWLSAPEEQVRTLDTFCMFSRYESFGYVTAEAMALGVPVVATATTGTVDLVHHEATGLLVEPSLQSVEAAVRRVASDHALRERVADQGRRMILEKHTMGRMVDDVEQIYHDELRRTSRSKSPALS